MTTAPDHHGYGLGTVVAEDDDGDPIVGHHGDVVAYHCSLAVWPEDGIAVTVLAPQGADRPLVPLLDRLHDTWVDS